MTTQKTKTFFEDKLVAEVYEKVRDSDGKRFYDTTIQRRYFTDNVEHRTNYLQKRDMQSIHLLAVAVERYITAQLWKNRKSGNVREEPDAVEQDTDSFLEE